MAQSKRQAEGVFDAANLYTEATFHNALDAQEGKSRILPTTIEIPAPVVKPGLQKTALKTDVDGDDIDPPVSKASGKPDDKDDFQLQRALAVLRFGSVAAAVANSPTPLYTPPTPKFITAKATPQHAPGTLVPIIAGAQSPPGKVAPPSSPPSP